MKCGAPQDTSENAARFQYRAPLMSVICGTGIWTVCSPTWRAYCRTISDLLLRKRDLNGDLRIQSPSSVLLETLRDPEQQFLHITVGSAVNQEVTW